MVWAILNQDKTFLPTYLKDLYSREPQQVDSLLSTLINPEDADNDLNIEKCLWVVCGGQKPEDFSKQIKSYDQSTICGLVWDANFIAYRCKTCGITPCMSLCAECFQNGDHEGHDFNMFKSQAGGACDCGDVDVMKPCGFCSRHGPKQKSVRSIPEDVTLMVSLVVPKLIHFLLYRLDDTTLKKHGKILQVRPADQEVADLLLRLCQMGDVTRGIVAHNMLNTVPKKLVYTAEVKASRDVLKPDLDMPPYHVITNNMTVADSIHSLPSSSSECQEESETALEILTDLLIELKFPQFLVTLVLSMLQESKYKHEFMKAFCSRYSKIANLLTHRFELDEDQKLSNRLVHASVQLFSNETLTYNMVTKHGLLVIIVSALSDLISRTLVKVDDSDDNINKSLFVVNCNHDIINGHRYWPVVSDFHNLLSHPRISHYFLQEAALIRRWMGILTHLTGMNKNIRQLIVHVQFESQVYQYAFSCEIETSSAIMTNLLTVCNSPAQKGCIRLVLSECVRALRSWFRMIQVQMVKPFLSDRLPLTATGPIPRHELTFHLPLHRYLAAFISQGVNYCGMSLEDVLPSEEVLWCTMEHVIRIQVGIGEILAGLWVRNGYQLRSQEEFYLQNHFCNSTVDLDLFLLQVCAMALDSDRFLTTMVQRYRLDHWFQFGVFASSSPPADNDVQQVLVESMLGLTLQLLHQRMYMGLSEQGMVHLEVVTRLAMGDFTHSQLQDFVPEKPGLSELTELFDEVLSKVSDYKPPTFESGQLAQGIYALKPNLWRSEFHPLHVMLRGAYKRGYQLAMDKYKGWYQTHTKTKVQGLWPPFRAPSTLNPHFHSLYRILSCGTLHALLFTVLYKAVREPDSVSDNIIYLTFYLLDLCIDAPEVPRPRIEKGCTKADITAAELDDGCVPQAIVKCVKFLQEHRTHPEIYTSGLSNERSCQQLVNKLINCNFEIDADEYSVHDVVGALLVMAYHRLQPPLFDRLYAAAKQLSITSDKNTHIYHIQQVLEQLTPHRYQLINLLMHHLRTVVKENRCTLEQICTVFVPHGVDPTAFSSLISRYNWVFRVRRRPAGTIESAFDIKYKNTSIVKNAYEPVLETSIFQCMYDLRKQLQLVDHNGTPTTGLTNACHTGVEAISNIITKLCDRDTNNAKLLITLERADASTPDRGTSPSQSSEAKRKRARARQAQLLADFASKQRVFVAQMEEEESEGPCASEAPASEQLEYQCAICGQCSCSTEESPIGTIVLCQPAGALLHAAPPDTRRLVDMEAGYEEISTVISTLTSHYTSLKNYYSASSCWQNVGLRLQPGIHIQTCSHSIHKTCHSSYSASLQNTNQLTEPLHTPLDLQGKELSCPLCRRIANSVLPIPPTSSIIPYSPTKVAVPVSSSQIPIVPSHKCQDVEYKSYSAGTCLGCSCIGLHADIKQVDHQAPIDSIKATILNMTGEYYNAVDSFTTGLSDIYKKYVEQKSISLLDIMLLTVQCTIQSELADRSNNLSPHHAATRKYCTGRLISVLATKASMFPESHQSNTSILSLISLFYPASNIELGAADLPPVLFNPSWLLYKFTLFSKLQDNWPRFAEVVRLLYCLQAMQSLINAIAKFSPDEQRAWVSKTGTAQDFDTLLGILCKELSLRGVTASSDEMDITSSVWSTQSIESAVQEACLPFLREAVLLGYHLYEKPLSMLPVGANEFSFYAQWLDLTPNSNTAFLEVMNLPQAKLVSVSVEMCRQLPGGKTQAPELPLVKVWAAPQLLTLPKLYGKLYLHYRHVKCRVCKQIPSDPALCLVCGQLVCVRSPCCHWLGTGECVKHSIKCGAGTAVYLVIMSSTVVIIRGERVYLWGSVYLDQHGEEDIDLKRGKPLYLSEQRVQCLTQQWLAHSFDHTCKRWGWHQHQF